MHLLSDVQPFIQSQTPMNDQNGKCLGRALYSSIYIYLDIVGTCSLSNGVPENLFPSFLIRPDKSRGASIPIDPNSNKTDIDMIGMNKATWA